MAGVKGNKNATGNKGGKGAPSVIDRELSKKVRSLTLEKIKDILEQPVVKMKHDDYDLYKHILIKLSGNVLPRLNAGRDDDERLIPSPLLGGKSNGKRNKSNKKTSSIKKKD